MKVKIETLGDLSDFLQTLKVSQLEQSPKVLPERDLSCTISEIEVTDEPFLVNQDDTSQAGYPSELRRFHREWEIKKFSVLEPKGTIIFHTK